MGVFSPSGYEEEEGCGSVGVWWTLAGRSRCERFSKHVLPIVAEKALELAMEGFRHFLSPFAFYPCWGSYSIQSLGYIVSSMINTYRSRKTSSYGDGMRRKEVSDSMGKRGESWKQEVYTITYGLRVFMIYTHTGEYQKSRDHERSLASEKSSKSSKS